MGFFFYRKNSKVSPGNGITGKEAQKLSEEKMIIQ
jgi:hypothetical protein